MQEGIKSFLRKKSVGWFLTLPACLSLILAFVFYSKNGITQFQPELDKTCIACCWAAFALGVLSMVFECKYVRFAAYLTALYSFMMFIYSQVTYIANILVSIDGNSFSKGFVLTAVMFLLGIALMLTAGCLTELHPGRKKEV